MKCIPYPWSWVCILILQALVKRSPSSGMSSTMKESSAFQSELRMPESAIRQQSSSPADKGKVTICDGKSSDDDKPKKSSVCKNIEGCREDLLIQVVWEFLRSSFSESVFILEVHLTRCNHNFFAGELLHSSPGAGVTCFPNGCHSDQFPAGIGSGQQQPGSARSQWIAHPRQDGWDDRSAHGMNQTPED